MACGCRGRGPGGCACGVEAGANVNITGSGTPADPWIISSASEVSDTLIQVSDTTSLNLSISGDGSVGDPYIISGAVIPADSTQILDTPTLNLTRTGSGTPADPWIISGVVVDPGRLTVQDTDTLNLTITGSGTTADPYVVSGVVDVDLTVQDSSTLDLTLTGTGTDADPWVLSGTVTPTEVAVDNSLPAGGPADLQIAGTGGVGDPYLLSAHETLIRRTWRQVIPKHESATIDTQGTATVTSTGTATAKAYTLTSKYTRARLVEQLVSTPATNAVAGYRNGDGQVARGDAAGVGGFYYKTLGGPATGAATTTHRFFMGLALASGAPTDVEPSSLVDMIGIGYDSADTNLSIMHNNDTGSATKVDLGASFPVPAADRTNLYTLELWCDANASAINYRVVNVVTGAVATGSVNTNIPAGTVILRPRGYASAGGTSSVIGFGFGGYVLHTDEVFG